MTQSFVVVSPTCAPTKIATLTNIMSTCRAEPPHITRPDNQLMLRVVSVQYPAIPNQEVGPSDTRTFDAVVDRHPLVIPSPLRDMFDSFEWQGAATCRL